MILYAHKHNLVDGTQSAYRVPFRNTILQALYPDVHVAILQASTDPDHREAMLQSLSAFVAAADGPALDFCTGAKKRGEFIATDKAVARRFWSTPEQAAAYGSNLLTDCCQEPLKLNLRVLVVEDGDHHTGDCHAKMGLGLAYELGHTKRAAQFRLAHSSFLAKGTAIYSPNVPLDVDLVIPLSAFKSSEKSALSTVLKPVVSLPNHLSKGLSKGVVWMSHETATLVGGDFDGDYFNFLPAARFPLMATEIRRWHRTRQVPPIVKVKERLASPWSALPRVMLDNTDNMVGLITYFTTQANAMGRLDFVAALAPELQIAVDKFKYNPEHDHAKLAAISGQLEPLAWLADRKSRDAFTQRPLHVDEAATDTISHLARRVAAAWEPPNLIAASLEAFAPLFPVSEATPTAHQEAARELARRYGQQVAAVICSGDRDGFSPIFHALREWADTRTDPNQWAAAVWHAVHRKDRKGTGSLVFHAFLGQLITRLQQPRQIPDQVSIVGLSHHEYADDLSRFDGQPHQVTVTEITFNGHLRQLVSVSGRTLDFVSTETPIAPGLYTLSLTWNGHGVVTATPAWSAPSLLRSIAPLFLVSLFPYLSCPFRGSGDERASWSVGSPADQFRAQTFLLEKPRSLVDRGLFFQREPPGALRPIS